MKKIYIKYLEDNKMSVFTDKEAAKKFFSNDNYNVVSATKIYMCIDFDVIDNKHIYSSQSFELWRAHYETDCLLSQFLLKNILDIDKKINSRLAYYLSEIIQIKNILTPQEKIKMKRMINESKQNIVEDYSYQNT